MIERKKGGGCDGEEYRSFWSGPFKSLPARNICPRKYSTRSASTTIEYVQPTCNLDFIYPRLLFLVGGLEICQRQYIFFLSNKIPLNFDTLIYLFIF
jgi:hypothetical protein